MKNSIDFDFPKQQDIKKFIYKKKNTIFFSFKNIPCSFYNFFLFQ